MKKSLVIAPIALVALMISVLFVPLVSASVYYITSLHSYGTYGDGQILGPQYIVGSSDKWFARIVGPDDPSDGGYIIGAASVTGTSVVSIYAFAAPSAGGNVYVYVGQYSWGPWDYVGSANVQGYTDQWYTVGYQIGSYNYVKVSSMGTNVFIDCVRMVTI